MSIRRRFGAAVAVIGAFAGFATVAPVGAQATLSSLLLDSPAPGFAPLTVAPALNGAVTEEGKAAPPGFTPPAGSGFVGGWGKTFFHSANGEALVSIVAEYESEPSARAGARRSAERALSEGAKEFDVADIPKAHGFSLDQASAGQTLTLVAIEFRYGKHVFALASVAPSPGLADEQVKLYADAQYRHAVANLPTPSDPPNIAYLIGFATLPVLGIAALVFWLVKRRSAPAPAYQTMGTPSTSPAMQTRWELDDAWAPVPANTYAAPSSASGVAPDAVSHAYARIEARPDAVRDSAPVKVESRPCPSCGKDFGTSDACVECGALRTECAVCGAKIWAGAMTCPAHSGMIR